MAFDPNIAPEWNKADPKPTQTKIDEGWKAEEKPPASVFNWFQNKTFLALKELLTNAIHKEEKGAANGLATLDGTSKVPATNLTNGTTSVKGIVQLSSATNSTSTALAATASAVKAAYDLANGKASTTEATTTLKGLMSAADKLKLDSVEASANNYTHPANHPATMITEDTTHRFMTDTEKTKLSGIATNANNYTHPANHPPSIITQDANNRFMTDTEKTKLAGIATNANNYVHPTGAGNNHIPTGGATTNVLRWSSSGVAVWGLVAASEVTEDADHRFMTDTEKTKLSGIATNANNYVHPTTAGNKHLPSGGTVGQVLTNSASGTGVWSDPTSTAGSISVADADGYFVGANVELALQEIGFALNGSRGEIVAAVNDLLTA